MSKHATMQCMRIQKVQSSLPSWNVDAILIGCPIDLKYLTGLDMSAGKLLITKQAPFLLVDSRYLEKCQKGTSIEVILDTPEQRSALFERLGALPRIGFDSRTTSYATFLDWQKMVPSGTTLMSLDAPMQRVRACKDPTEIAAIRASALLTVEGLHFLRSKIQVGVTERELARALERFWLEKGADGSAFEPIIAFAEHSSMPHWRSSDTPLKPDSVVLIDIGVTLNGYASDMTRMLFFGRPPEEIVAIHEIVLRAQRKAINAVCPGISVAALDRIARELIAEAGYGPHFLHRLGHGVGMEIHEYPSLTGDAAAESRLLAPGMVITIEPGIYLSGLGGVRIEDTVLVTETGHEELTCCPSGPFVV